ncbi:MAG: uracil-DNA glycosylase [Burkholderiales bacterium]|nr:uracil-DNA glycosylase [Burkholderiales bacterium]
MSSRRDLMLEEMGLTPVWRLRACVAPVAAPVTNHESRVPSSESRVTVRGARNEGQASGVSNHEGGDRRAAIMRMDWAELKASVAACTACALHARRNRTVFGVGDEHADWLFVGEGPGADEDRLGEPFVGQAGRLLDGMLAAIHLKRGENAYIANVVKCRPPGNRNPEPDEALACEPYLHRQIELIRPKLIVALGKVAAVNLLAREASVASLRGKIHDYRGIPLIVTYHPAYLLRSLPDKAKAWVDLRFAVDTMKELQNRAATAERGQ